MESRAAVTFSLEALHYSASGLYEDALTLGNTALAKKTSMSLKNFKRLHPLISDPSKLWKVTEKPASFLSATRCVKTGTASFMYTAVSCGLLCLNTADSWRTLVLREVKLQQFVE